MKDSRFREPTVLVITFKLKECVDVCFNGYLVCADNKSIELLLPYDMTVESQHKYLTSIIDDVEFVPFDNCSMFEEVWRKLSAEWDKVRQFVITELDTKDDVTVKFEEDLSINFAIKSRTYNPMYNH